MILPIKPMGVVASVSSGQFGVVNQIFYEDWKVFKNG